jgi:hypothetical protein
MKSDITQIRIGKHDFGIIGLPAAIKMAAAEHKGASDDMIADALYKVLSKDNYISDNIKDAYKQAFLREYQKFLGLSVTAEGGIADELTVTVVGRTGCDRCKNLEMDIMMVLSELDLPARVGHVRDPGEIKRMGIHRLPAVLINDEVKCSGVVPSKAQLIKWFSRVTRKKTDSDGKEKSSNSRRANSE